MPQPSAEVNVATMSRNRNSKIVKWFKQWDLQLMVLPALGFIFVFNYLPMYGITAAFKDYDIINGLQASPWVGFKHFDDFFNGPDFWKVMRNTLFISLLKLIIVFPAPILLALMLNEIKDGIFKRFVQSVSYLPNFISWVIVAGFVTSMLSVDNGSVNMSLEKLNLIEEPINFLTIPEYFWGILIASNVWKEVGFSSIVYLAAIAGIDQSMYEAAEMDGASRFKQMFHITLPSISPVIIIFGILAIGNLLNAGFEDILIFTKNNPILWDVSDVIDTYVLRMGIDNYRYSFAAAIGLFKSVISIALLTAANYLARRSGHSLW